MVRAATNEDGKNASISRGKRGRPIRFAALAVALVAVGCTSAPGVNYYPAHWSVELNASSSGTERTPKPLDELLREGYALLGRIEYSYRLQTCSYLGEREQMNDLSVAMIAGGPSIEDLYAFESCQPGEGAAAAELVIAEQAARNGAELMSIDQRQSAASWQIQPPRCTSVGQALDGSGLLECRAYSRELVEVATLSAILFRREPWIARHQAALLAAQEGDAERLAELIRDGIDVNYDFAPAGADVRWPTTLLCVAVVDLRTVELLLEAGADPRRASRYVYGAGDRPVLCAASDGVPDVYELLAGLTPPQDDDEPIKRAIETRNAPMIEYLLDHGSALPVDAYLSSTVVHLAPDATALALVLDRGLAPCPPQDKGRALRAAAEAHSTRSLRILLERGCDPTEGTNDPHGYPASYAAGLSGWNDGIAVLLEAGMAPHVPFEYRSPLVGAAVNGWTDTLELLLAAGAPVDATFETYLYGLAPELFDRYSALLAAAASSGYSHVVAYLLERGADPDILDSEPLRAAIAAGQILAVEYLIEAGATVTPEHVRLARELSRDPRPQFAQVRPQLKHIVEILEQGVR